MNERRFDLRLSCRYQGSENTVTELFVVHFEKDVWKPLGLGETSPGFLIFVYSIFTCQHLYMRTNCAERDLLLASADGSICLTTDDDWRLKSLQIDFVGQLGSGQANEADIDYIVGRMRQCPVSRNLPEIADSHTRLCLETPKTG